jgi:Animal haem peroxidase
MNSWNLIDVQCFKSKPTGVSIPRQASDKAFLPSARDISLAVHKDVDNPHDHLTAFTAIWGELIHHDISHTPQMAGELNRIVKVIVTVSGSERSQCLHLSISADNKKAIWVRDCDAAESTCTSSTRSAIRSACRTRTPFTELRESNAKNMFDPALLLEWDVPWVLVNRLIK